MIKHLHNSLTSSSDTQDLAEPRIESLRLEDLSEFEIEHADVLKAIENKVFEPSDDVLNFIMQKIQS